jgi:hypothetical protein
VGGRNTKVGEWTLGVDVLEVVAVGDGGEARYPGGVEACSEDDDVDFNFVAIGIEESLFSDFRK